MAVNGKGEDFNGSSASKRKRAAASIEAERGAYAELLQTCLRNQFAIEDAELLSFLQAECGFVELYPGDRLIEQGVKHDDVYFVLSGRLRAVRTNEDGQSVTLGEIGRGETVGELALFTGEPRSADVIAVRNSFIAILSRATVEAAIAKLPTFALAMTKTVIERFRREQEKTKPPAPPVIVTVMPISPGVDAIGFVQRLAEKQRAYSSKVAILDLKAVSARFGSLSKPDILRPRG
ncbi:MAG: cyclic nucleotide-binding domain-containing protein, partial [Pseudomonadota bacterium]